MPITGKSKDIKKPDLFLYGIKIRVYLYLMIYEYQLVVFWLDF